MIKISSVILNETEWNGMKLIWINSLDIILISLMQN